MLATLQRLPSAMRPLLLRRHGRNSLSVGDEYDLQDAVEVALRLMYPDVRPEEHTPSSAGSASRIDFLVKRERVAVEVKVTRPGRSEKQIKPEALVDIHDYQEHPSVDTLVIVVYDLASTFVNGDGFADDLSGTHGKLQVNVLVVGWPVPPSR
jgi:hypothetical protein